MDVKLNYSSLYNAMIHPFTRMTIYGAIWYQGKTDDGEKKNFCCLGESNSGRNTDKYPCTFSNMIRFWRQAWDERTNHTTDIQFPFGFVQVIRLILISICMNNDSFL